MVTGSSTVSAMSENGKSRQTPWAHLSSVCRMVPEKTLFLVSCSARVPAVAHPESPATSNAMAAALCAL